MRSRSAKDTRVRGDSESKTDEGDKQTETPHCDASWGHLVANMWPYCGHHGASGGSRRCRLFRNNKRQFSPCGALRSYQCIGVHVYQYTGIPMYPCTYVQVNRCASPPLYLCIIITMYRCTSACIGVQVYRNTNVLVYPYNFVPMYRCT